MAAPAGTTAAAPTFQDLAQLVTSVRQTVRIAPQSAVRGVSRIGAHCRRYIETLEAENLLLQAHIRDSGQPLPARPATPASQIQLRDDFNIILDNAGGALPEGNAQLDIVTGLDA